MPTLNWVGKDAVVRHHQEVPFRLLEPVPELSCGENGKSGDSGKLIVQGDNLHALKALLARYAGQVKCIYIDPPYNKTPHNWSSHDDAGHTDETKKGLNKVPGPSVSDTPKPSRLSNRQEIPTCAAHGTRCCAQPRRREEPPSSPTPI